jgi:hypothetical protein
MTTTGRAMVARQRHESAPPHRHVAVLLVMAVALALLPGLGSPVAAAVRPSVDTAPGTASTEDTSPAVGVLPWEASGRLPRGRGNR